MGAGQRGRDLHALQEDAVHGPQQEAPLPQVRLGGVRAVLVQALRAARAERQAAARVPAVLRRPHARPRAPRARARAR